MCAVHWGGRSCSGTKQSQHCLVYGLKLVALSTLYSEVGSYGKVDQGQRREAGPYEISEEECNAAFKILRGFTLKGTLTLKKIRKMKTNVANVFELSVLSLRSPLPR